LWRFGSACSSLVVKLSSSLRLPANMKVKPLMTVSTACADMLPDCCCRNTKVKLKINSSSFWSLRRNVGGDEGSTSGSCTTCKHAIRSSICSRAHLYILYRRIIERSSSRGVSCGRVLGGRDMEEGAIARVGDGDSRNRNCANELDKHR
jgi:hypothetical protein